jgi:nucleotide-binding universal stress UspA family protein
MSIVVAYEATPEADAALDAGIAEAELRGLPLHLVTYVGGAVVEGPGEAKVSRTQHDAADEALAAAVSRATAGGVSATSHVVGGLDPAGAIVELARQVDAQLVVTGMRRRSAVGKLLMGSTSRDLIMAADCPVLAVKSAS